MIHKPHLNLLDPAFLAADGNQFADYVAWFKADESGATDDLIDVTGTNTMSVTSGSNIPTATGQMDDAREFGAGATYGDQFAVYTASPATTGPGRIFSFADGSGGVVDKTIALWLYAYGTTNSEEYILGTNGAGSGLGGDPVNSRLMLESCTTAGDPKRLKFGIYDDSFPTPQWVEKDCGLINMNTWYHVAFGAYTSGSGAAVVFIQLDKGTMLTQTAAQNPGTYNQGQTSFVGGYNKPFYGRIDHIGVWERLIGTNAIDLLADGRNYS